MKEMLAYGVVSYSKLFQGDYMDMYWSSTKSHEFWRIFRCY